MKTEVRKLGTITMIVLILLISAIAIGMPNTSAKYPSNIDEVTESKTGFRRSGNPLLHLIDDKKWIPIESPEPSELAPDRDVEHDMDIEIYDVKTRKVKKIPKITKPEKQDPSKIPGNPGLLPSKLVPESVFPPDERVRITPTTTYPWSSICKLFIITNDGSLSSGTGFIIDGCHILTAGHCVYSHDNGGWALSIGVVPAFDNGYMPYWHAWATTFRTYEDWTVHQSYQHDWALLTLDRNVGDYTGWMGMMTANPSDPVYTGTLSTAGYPGDLDYGWCMYYDADEGKSADEYNHWYYMDTYGGQSGSPVWHYDENNDPYVLSILAYGEYYLWPGSNMGTRINSNKFNDINSWRSSDIPQIDYANLIDDGQAFSGFSTTTVVPGETIFGVWSSERNIGTAESGDFYVSYYASTDTEISESDYLIGTVNVPSIYPFNYYDSEWSGTFPSDIPSGTYWVGWIIDSTDVVPEPLDDGEGNNVAYKESYQLTVEPIQEDLIIEGNEKLVIENCVYNHSGNIIVRDNASLILRNATLALYWPSFHKYDISFQGSSYFESFNSTITDTPSSFKGGGYYLFMMDGSFANITSSRFHYPAALLDARGRDVTVKILDSHLDNINIGSYSNVEINNSQANVHIYSGSNVTIRDSKNIGKIQIQFKGSDYAELSLKPGYHSYWSLKENETVINCDIDLNIINSTISRWSLRAYGQPNINVKDSILGSVVSLSEASFNLENVIVTRISSEDNSSITLRDSTIRNLDTYDSSKVRMFNTSVDIYGQVNVFNDSEIYIGWYLDVTLLDEGGPIEGANVEVYAVPEGSLIDSKSTNGEGLARFKLWEKILRANGTDFVNTYNVACVHQGVRLSEQILLNDNYELEINFAGVSTFDINLYEGWNLIGLPIIPEDPSIEAVLSDILPFVESAWAYDGGTREWSSYSPGAPSDLTEMHCGKGYWLKMNEDVTWTFEYS